VAGADDVRHRTTEFRIEGNGMTTHSRLARRSHRLSHTIVALGVGLAAAAAWTPLAGAIALSLQTNATNPCGLLTVDEVQGLGTPKEHASSGVAEAMPAQEVFTCRYTWGAGTERYTFAVSVNSVSRMFVGMTGDAAKQHIVS